MNYNSEHELLRKFELDPNLLQKIGGLEQWGLEKYRRISRVQNEEIKEEKMMKEKKESWSKKMLEHRGRCYLKGGRM